MVIGRPLRAVAFQKPSSQVKIFDVLKYGATGDGKALDTAAIQRAIDEAAAYSGKAQVLVRGGHKYLIGTIELKGAIDFHLADDAELLVSTRREDYRGGLANYLQVITAQSTALSDQVTAVEILTRRLQASVLLVKALGGGWTTSQIPRV